MKKFLFTLLSCAVAAAVSAAPSTFLSLKTDPGEWIGGGATYYFDGNNGGFNTSLSDWEYGYPKSQVALYSNSSKPVRSDWSFRVTTYGFRVPLEEGYYHNSYFGDLHSDLSDKALDSAEVSFDAFGRGYSSPTARFSIFDLSFSSDETIQSFAIAFEIREYGSKDSIYGVLSYNSSAFEERANIEQLSLLGLDKALPSSVPEPSSHLLASIGILAFLVARLNYRKSKNT